MAMTASAPPQNSRVYSSFEEFERDLLPQRYSQRRSEAVAGDAIAARLAQQSLDRLRAAVHHPLRPSPDLDAARVD